MGYFRKFFEEDPSLLKTSSNELLLDRFKADHPSHTDRELKKARQNLANLKSVLRKQKRLGKSIKTAPRANAVKAVPVLLDFGPTLEGLEEHIDECLGMARSLDRALLVNTIRLLRAARNDVSMLIG
jgi:hypothetical protein